MFCRKKKDLDTPQKTRHEKDVSSVITTITSVVNPFEIEQSELLHLTNGLVATEEIKSDLLAAKEKGEKHLDTFIKDKLCVSDPDIFSPITKLKLKTFSSMAKKVKVTAKGGGVAMLQANRNLFARMLLLAQSRNVDMKEVLSFPLGPFPLSLSTEMGTLHKTQKSKFLRLIESTSQEAISPSVPQENALIVDGMAMIQSVKNLPSSFGEFANMLLKMLINLGLQSKSLRIDFVTDTYPDGSIKDLERRMRASDGAAIIRIHGASQKLPTQWKKFLKFGKNKEALVQFLFQHWCTCKSGILHGLTLYVSHGNECHQLLPAAADDREVIVQMIDDLCCDHEEADTRLLLHASHATDYQNIIIRSPDTDVFILLIHFCSDIGGSLYFLTGLKDTARVLHINRIAQVLGQNKCKAILGFHAFTGNKLYTRMLYFRTN